MFLYEGKGTDKNATFQAFPDCPSLKATVFPPNTLRMFLRLWDFCTIWLKSNIFIFIFIISEVRGQTCEPPRDGNMPVMMKPHEQSFKTTHLQTNSNKKLKKWWRFSREMTNRKKKSKRQCSFTVRSLYTVACWFYIYTFLHRSEAEGLFYSRKYKIEQISHCSVHSRSGRKASTQNSGS